MHVVILAEFAVASGGAEKVAVESARALADAGVAVSYVQAIDGPADLLLEHPRIRRLCLGLADIWSLPAWQGAATGIWHATAATRLAAALDTIPPADIVHLHQWTRALSPSAMPVLYARGAPVALTLHEYFLACPNGLYFRFDRGEPCALKPMSLPCLGAACDPKSRLHKAVRFGRSLAMHAAIRSRRLDVIHVCDASLARMGAMLEDLPLRHHRVDNPVRVAWSATADPASRDAVVYVGRLTREKGADLVAAAAQRAGLPALFIGAGPLEESLRGQPGIDMLGWRSPAEVQGVLNQRARVVCAPSRWYETGPLTVYEALAQGLPVVASARSGASEKVRHGIDGFVVEPEPDALASTFSQLRDDDLVRRMGAAAHERFWAAPLSLSAHAESLLRVYDTMLLSAADRPLRARIASGVDHPHVATDSEAGLRHGRGFCCNPPH